MRNVKPDCNKKARQRKREREREREARIAEIENLAMDNYPCLPCLCSFLCVCASQCLQGGWSCVQSCRTSGCLVLAFPGGAKPWNALTLRLNSQCFLMLIPYFSQCWNLALQAGTVPRRLKIQGAEWPKSESYSEIAVSQTPNTQNRKENLLFFLACGWYAALGRVAYFEMCHSRSLGRVANLKDEGCENEGSRIEFRGWMS